MLQACERTYLPSPPHQSLIKVAGKHTSAHGYRDAQGECSRVFPFTCILVICKLCVLISAVLHRSTSVCAESQPSYCLGNECLSPLSPNKEICMNQWARQSKVVVLLRCVLTSLPLLFPCVNIPASSQLFCCNPFMDTSFQSPLKPRTRR